MAYYFLMRLLSVRTQNYTSIIDSGLVEIEPKITTLVGKTGSGKTSFLQMIQGVDEEITFKQTSLPNGSQTKQKFLNGAITAAEILQLTSTFIVEELDKESLPEGYEDITEIELKRYFDGHYEIKPKGKYTAKSIQLDEEIARIDVILETIKTNITTAEGRLPQIKQHREKFFKSLDSFKNTNFKNSKELDLSLKSFTNACNALPQDGPLKNELVARTNELNAVRKDIGTKLENDPLTQLQGIIPNPLYKNDVFELEDQISIDEFIKNPSSSDTFGRIAVIGDLKPSGLEKIRTASTAEQNSYLDLVSNNISEQFNNFWKQDHYTFKLRIDGPNLNFTVSDQTTGKETSVLERSDGFKWWAAFFLEIATFLAETSGLSIILLDNPATELHDDGKADVLRFITKAADSGKLQIIYTTHERALIDPWRIDRVRLVEKSKEGTHIAGVKTDSRADLLNKIRKNIGSPAKYSLFGAPRTVSFEGISDMNIFSAFNEYFEQKRNDFLNKDTASINSFNGLDKAPDTCKLYKDLGLEFVLVVDSGSATKDMKQRLEDGNFKTYFVEIKDILDKTEVDMEDLIEPKLYYQAFEMAYKPILDQVPSFEEIESIGSGKKLVQRYARWFSDNRKGEFNKTIVAEQMFNVLMKSDVDDETEEIKKSVENFLKLITAIQNKFQ